MKYVGSVYQYLVYNGAGRTSVHIFASVYILHSMEICMDICEYMYLHFVRGRIGGGCEETGVGCNYSKTFKKHKTLNFYILLQNIVYS